MIEIERNKITFFQTRILVWYDENKRVFPWRRSGISTYKKVIAEILLQRTNAVTAGRFYKSFFVKYPSWTKLSEASIGQLQEFLQPIGLGNQRGERLYRLAQEMKKRNWRFPKDRVDLEQLPMMGQYIANSVNLLVFKLPSPLLDVNMARLLERFFQRRNLADIRYDPYLQSLSLSVVKHIKSKELNWAILDFAAMICKSQRPKCEICFLSKKCAFFNSLKSI